MTVSHFDQLILPSTRTVAMAQIRQGTLCQPDKATNGGRFLLMPSQISSRCRLTKAHQDQPCPDMEVLDKVNWTESHSQSVNVLADQRAICLQQKIATGVQRQLQHRQHAGCPVSRHSGARLGHAVQAVDGCAALHSPHRYVVHWLPEQSWQ